MNAARELTIEIGGIVVEGASPEEAGRVRRVIEQAVAEAARKLAGRAGGASTAISLGDLRFELGAAAQGLAAGAEAEIARRLEAAIATAWEAAR